MRCTCIGPKFGDRITVRIGDLSLHGNMQSMTVDYHERSDEADWEIVLEPGVHSEHRAEVAVEAVIAAASEAIRRAMR